MCLCACMIHCRTVGRRVAWKLVHTSHWLWSRHWVSESTESTELGNANWTKFWRSEWNLAKKFSLHKMLWRLKAANCQSFSLAKRGRTFPSIQGTSCHFALTAEPPATQLICDLCRTKRPATKTGLKNKLRQNPSPDLALQSTWIGRLSNLMSLDVTWCHLMSSNLPRSRKKGLAAQRHILVRGGLFRFHSAILEDEPLRKGHENSKTNVTMSQCFKELQRKYHISIVLLCEFKSLRRQFSHLASAITWPRSVAASPAFWQT